jgi:hypothetical protein
MATKLKPFTPEASCPKCGHQEIRNTWEEAVDPCGINACKAHPGKPERIVRVCQSCRYSWEEAPLDR